MMSITRNDVVLRSTMNFLQPFIMTMALFFVANYQMIGFIALVYAVMMIMASMIMYYLCYGKRKTNMFFSVVLLKRIIFILFGLYLLVASMCLFLGQK